MLSFKIKFILKLEHISFKQRACIGAWNTIFMCFFLLLFLCCFSSLKFHCFAVFAFNVNKDNSFNNVLQCLLLNKPHKKKKRNCVYVLYVNMNKKRSTTICVKINKFSQLPLVYVVCWVEYVSFFLLFFVVFNIFIIEHSGD